MSTNKTLIDITCRNSDSATVLKMEESLKLGLIQKRVGTTNFVLFTVESKGLIKEDLLRIINQFNNSNWKFPEYCTMLIEDDHHEDLNGVTLPDYD